MKEYYVQDLTRSEGRDAMIRWKHNNHGYVLDIREAKVFTKEEADAVCDSPGTFDLRMWSKEYIDARTLNNHHVNMQLCDYEDTDSH